MMDTGASESAKPLDYDAFLSYTQRDRPVVAGLQKGLHHIGRRMGQLRALRVFRDDTDLTASPDLWGRIVDALDRSRFLIVTLSPLAAQSHWVNKEISYWLQHRGREQLMLVLAGGQLRWDQVSERFDPQTSDAAPPVLTEPGVLPAEPLFIDVSGDAPWDHRGPVFREKVTALAAPIHGKPKDQLASDDLREQRRFRRLWAAAIAGLALLTVIAVVAGAVAVVQRQRAIEQRDAAIVQRLDTEAQAILDRNRLGSDVRAFQELMAAQRIASSDHRTPDDGSVFDALVARPSTIKVFDTQRPVTYMAVSPTGDRLATTTSTGGVRLWNADTGKKIGESGLAGNGVAFSPDGSRFAVATAGSPGNVGMWDARTGQQLRTFTGPTQSSTRVKFSLDGRRIAAAGFDGTAWVWNVGTGARELRLAHPGRVNAVAFSPVVGPGEPLIATGGDDKTVRVWDAVTGRLVHAMTGHVGDVNDLSFSPDGRTLASAGQDSVRLWNPDTGDDEGELNNHGAVDSVAWSPNPAKTELAAAGTSGAVHLWTFAGPGHLDFGTEIVLPGQIDQVQDVAYSAGGSRVTAGGVDGAVYTWDPNSAATMQIGSPVTSVAWSRDGQRIAAAWVGGVDLWDPQTRSRVGDSLLGQTGVVFGVAFDPLEKLIAAGGDDGTVSLWDRETGQLTRTLPGSGARLHGVAFSPDGRLLASGGDDHSVRLWDPYSGDLKRTLTNPTDGVICVAFSPAEHLVAAGSADHKLYVWDTDTGALRRTVSTAAPVDAVAFSPDGRRIATGGGDNAVQVWDTDTGKAARGALRGHTNAVHSVVFSPDGRFIASASDDNTVRLWDTGTGKPIGRPMIGQNQLWGVAFSRDGRQLVSGGLDGALQLWSVSVSAAELCAKLTANPSHQQWNEWITPDIGYMPACPNLQPASDSG